MADDPAQFSSNNAALMQPVLRLESYAASRKASQIPFIGGDSQSTIRVALGGNCSMEFMVPGIVNRLREAGVAGDVYPLPFDAWIPQILDNQISADICIIWLSAMGISRGGTERGDVPLDAIQGALESLVDKGIRTILLLPEALDVEADIFSPFCAWRQSLVDNLRARAPSRVIIVHTDSLQRELRHVWHAGRYWSTAKCPCHPDAMTSLGGYLASVILRSVKPAVRAVVVDLDNTLWGGVVGEDGVDGIDLDVHGSGAPHLKLQRFLKDLAKNGVPVCVASKNNDEDARAPFLERPEMILQLEDIVYFYANWDHKAGAIQRIAQDLNLTPDTICFLDDSPVERGLASSLVPGLIVPDLPDDPEMWSGFLVGSGLFLQPVVSDVDLERVSFYKADALRRSEQDAVQSPEEYMRSLSMTLRAMPVAAANSARVLSLIHKTNQFNLTTARLTPSEISEISENPTNYAFCFDYTDRFGPGGIIGVLLGTRSGKTLTIAILLLSCRVLNRGVEDAVLEHLLVWCREHGIEEILGNYRPTPKNVLAAGYYPRLGFAKIDGAEGQFVLAVTHASPPLHHVSVTTL